MKKHDINMLSPEPRVLRQRERQKSTLSVLARSQLKIHNAYIPYCFYINAVKNLRNTTNTNTLQDDNAGRMEMHCNPAIIAYKNTNIN